MDLAFGTEKSVFVCVNFFFYLITAFARILLLLGPIFVAYFDLKHFEVSLDVKFYAFRTVKNFLWCC